MKNTFIALVRKYLGGKASPAEQQFVEQVYEKLTEKDQGLSDEGHRLLAQVEQNLLTAIRKKPQPLWPRIAVAACVVLLLGIGSYFVFFAGSAIKQPGLTARHTGSDVLPGSFKAKLTLADGRTIILDSAGEGKLAEQAGMLISNKAGQIQYEGSGVSPDAVAYNTMSTARGETYSVRLADGSIVTLNSGSSVYFPVAFNGPERRIKVTGEVYIKVAKNPAQPFIATARGMDVMALGTEFSISAYENEKTVRATLAEGKVKVTKSNAPDDKGVMLAPGERADMIDAGAPIVASKDPDIDKTLAWVQNKFIFDDDQLPEVMQKLERWYDVEVAYEGNPKANKRFGGIISRRRNASEVLTMLKESGAIRFRIEGRKIIVTP